MHSIDNDNTKEFFENSNAGRKKAERRQQDADAWRQSQGLPPRVPRAPPAPDAALRGRGRGRGRGASAAAPAPVPTHVFEALDFERAKTLLPPYVGAGMIVAADGRWRLMMRGQTATCPKQKTFSSSFNMRSDNEAFRHLLKEAWKYLFEKNGTICPYDFSEPEQQVTPT